MNRWFKNTLMSAVTAAVLVPTAVAGVALAASPPAPAPSGVKTVTPIVCENSTTGLCLTTGSKSQIVTIKHTSATKAQFVGLSRMCNSGHVTSTCGFTVGSGLNTRYKGDLIIAIKLANGKCLAQSSSQGTCPNSQGNGGATGTVLVLAATGSNHGYLVSRYSSDLNFSQHKYNHPEWVCSQSATVAAKTLVWKDSAPAATCQWGAYSK